MTDEQWTTLKAIAPFLTICCALLSCGVAALTSVLVARYSAKNARALAVENDRRKDVLEEVRPIRTAINELSDFVDTLPAMARLAWDDREALVPSINGLAQKVEFFRSPAFYSPLGRITAKMHLHQLGRDLHETGQAVVAELKQFAYALSAPTPDDHAGWAQRAEHLKMQLAILGIRLKLELNEQLFPGDHKWLPAGILESPK